MSEYAIYVGCVIANRFPFIETASNIVMDKLGIKTKIITDFGCCPDPSGFQCIDQKTWMALAARNLAIAEEAKSDILTFCNGCFETLKSVNIELKHNGHLKEVNEILAKTGKEYKGTINVYHLLEILYNEIGTEAIQKAVTKRMDGLRVATFYGCHYGRPSHILNFDDPIRPVSLDKVVEATGAKSVEYLKKYQCCGSAISGVNEEAQTAMLESKLRQIERVQADVLVVVCPACFTQFEMNQGKVNKAFNTNYKIPTLYFTEFLALAFGANPDELGLKYHRVKLKNFLEKI
ncbi:MAG: CoB--CoM heterodisulfide reductase iron-sulfur subunit B family protein [Candidatus Helarchaeota archaeon]